MMGKEVVWRVGGGVACFVGLIVDCFDGAWVSSFGNGMGDVVGWIVGG